MCETFRNYKALQNIELFFSSGCNTRDEGGGEGECATGKGVQRSGEAGQTTVPTNSPFPALREEPASSTQRKDTHSGDAGLSLFHPELITFLVRLCYFSNDMSSLSLEPREVGVFCSSNQSLFDPSTSNNLRQVLH